MAFINLAQIMYPIGSYYISNQGQSPANLFGGVWTEIQDKFLYASKGNALQEGGQKNHNHSVSISYVPYWGNLCGADNSNPDTSLLQIGENDKLVSKIQSEWSHYTNQSAVAGWQSVNQPWIVKKSGNTTSTSTLPPYLTCHIFYRTA